MTSLLVTQTKLLVPRRRSDVVSRPRLLTLLSDLLDYRLILTTAPAGYGKTTLLTDFARQDDNVPVCWYALDPLDQDLQRFVAHFIASLRQQFPDFGQMSLSLLRNLSDLEGELDQLTATLVNDAYEHIREHFLLVLDDFHLVENNPVIAQFVMQFVQQAAENCHLVLASRTLPKLPDLALMLARNEVAGLDFETLAFRPHEIQALVAQNYRREISDETAAAIAHKSDGWITGLRLAAQQLGTADWSDPSQVMFDQIRAAQASGVGLDDYFSQQVLEMQTPDTQIFLLRTSVLEEFDANLCAAVFQGDKVGGEAAVGYYQTLIDEVIRSNLFVLPVGDYGWIRYHHLFRDFLRNRLERERVGECEQVAQKLGDVYAANGEWEKAFDIYQKLGSKAKLAELVERASQPLLANGRLQTLASWIDAVPQKDLEVRPQLLSARAAVAISLGDADAIRLLDKAVPLLRAHADTAQLALALNRRAYAHHLKGDFERAVADLREAQALGAELGESLRIEGVCMLRLGHVSEAADLLEQAAAVFAAEKDNYGLILVYADLGHCYRLLGKYDQSKLAYEKGRANAVEIGDLTQQAGILNNLGVLYHKQGFYEEAIHALEQSLAFARQTGLLRKQAYALTSIGDVYYDLDTYQSAMEAFKQARMLVDRIGDDFLTKYINFAQIAIARERGDIAQAQTLLSENARLVFRQPSHDDQGRYELEAGLVIWAQNRPVDATAFLQRAVEHFKAGGQWDELAPVHLHLAELYRELGDKDNMIFHFSQLVEVAAQLQTMHTLTMKGRRAKLLLAALRKRRGPLGSLAKQLYDQVAEFEGRLPKIRQMLRLQTTAVPFAPPQLRISAFGEMQVLENNEPISAPEWKTQRKVKALLFLLLAHETGLTKERIGLLLWPDASSKALTKALKNTLYKLRLALGKQVVVFDGDRYYFNRDLDYTYDVEEFHRAIAHGQAAADVKTKIAAFRRAISLYQGDYLPEFDETWVIPERENLNMTYIDVVVSLGNLYLEQGKYKHALKESQRALSFDNTLEQAYRLAMQACGEMGDRSGVKRQFDRCCKYLEMELGVMPSTQTVELFKRLQR